MNDNKVDSPEFNETFKQLLMMSAKYSFEEDSVSDVERKKLAFKVNTLYLKACLLVVHHELFDQFDVPVEILDSIHQGIISEDSIAEIATPFEVPMVQIEFNQKVFSALMSAMQKTLN